MTDEQLTKLMRSIVNEIKRRALAEAEHVMDQSNYYWEPEHTAGFTRKFCVELLDVAMANGLGGCQLCQG